MSETEQKQQEQQEVKQQFALQRLYVKDLSFETPMGPVAFTKQWKPQMKVDLNTKSGKLDEHNFEVVLTVTVTAQLEEETVFLIEAQQAGIFLIQGLEGEQLRRVLGTMCPGLLFPYVREVIDSLAVKGGFPPIGLQPVNFDALYLQAQQQQAKQQAEKH